MAKEKRASGSTFWVLTQHDEATVMESDARPSTDAEAGERLKGTLGPFTSKEAATKAADDYTARTLRGRAGK